MIFLNGKPIDDTDLEALPAPDPVKVEKARKRQKIRRNTQTMKRMLARPTSTGVWGVSQHRGAGGKWAQR